MRKFLTVSGFRWLMNDIVLPFMFYTHRNVFLTSWPPSGLMFYCHLTDSCIPLWVSMYIVCSARWYLVVKNSHDPHSSLAGWLARQMFSLRSNKRGSSQNLSLAVLSKISSLQLSVLQVILDYGFQGRNFASKSYKLFLSKSKFLKFSKFNQINPFPRRWWVVAVEIRDANYRNGF